jgi:hypothetical protein
MDQRSFVLALVSTLLPAAAARAEGVAIDHKPVGCIVAGSYPRLNACFAPVSRLARARVYFRVADATPEWYYVEMKSDAPCFAGILPKPKKQLVGRKVQYYLDAFDRAFAEARTDETEALVVASKSDCDSKLPVAPLLRRASVAVFPGVPEGFTGATGLGLGTTAAIVGGGAALAGGGIAAASGHSGSGGGSSPTGGSDSSTPPDTIPPTTTTTTTTTTLPGFNPVFKVSKGGVPVDYTKPIIGTEPLTLTIDMCETTGPYPLRFSVDVDGVSVRDTCHSTVTFTTVSASSGPGSPVHASAASRTYGLRLHIHSVAANNDPKANRTTTVEVSSNACATDTQGPVVTLTMPPPGSVFSSSTSYPVHFEASADDSRTGNNGISQVEYKANGGVVATSSGPSPWPANWSESAVNAWLASLLQCQLTATLQAYAVDGCGNATLSQGISATLISTAPSCALGFLARPETTATWVSELAVPGGSGQVVVNGEAVFPREGRSPIAVRPQAGTNRIEATLVEARSAGSWRFELGSVPGLRADSLRVVAGEVVQAAADVVVFRLHGRPGERIVFSFEVER